MTLLMILSGSNDSMDTTKLFWLLQSDPQRNECVQDAVQHILLRHFGIQALNQARSANDGVGIAHNDCRTKTGLIDNVGANAEVIRDSQTPDSLSHIISVISNLGFRSTDPASADRKCCSIEDDPGPMLR